MKFARFLYFCIVFIFIMLFVNLYILDRPYHHIVFMIVGTTFIASSFVYYKYQEKATKS